MDSRLAMKPFDLNTRRTRAEIGNIHWRDELLQARLFARFTWHHLIIGDPERYFLQRSH